MAARLVATLRTASATCRGWTHPAALPVYVPRRRCGYSSSPYVDEIETYDDYEVCKNPPEWKHVEQLIAPLTVPTPKPKACYPSGWRPQDPEASSRHPYFVPRNKNFMLPVHLSLSHRGMRRITVVKRVQGDLFALRDELMKTLEQKHNRVIGHATNELHGSIHIKGDYFYDVENYLYEKGF